MTAPLVNAHGRELGELDVLKARYHAQQNIEPGQSYSVCAADGTPICGFVANDRTLPHDDFTWLIWSRATTINPTSVGQP